MRIKAVCKTHKDAVVFLLEATTNYMNPSKDYVDESSERAQYVELDEANLYCTYTESLTSLREVATTDHEVGFEVVNEDTSEDTNVITTHGEYVDPVGYDGIDIRPAGDI